MRIVMLWCSFSLRKLQRACTWRTWLSVNSWYLDATNRRSRVFASSSAFATPLCQLSASCTHALIVLGNIGSRHPVAAFACRQACRLKPRKPKHVAEG